MTPEAEKLRDAIAIVVAHHTIRSPVYGLVVRNLCAPIDDEKAYRKAWEYLAQVAAAARQ